MKFKDYKYERLNYETTSQQYKDLINKLQRCQDAATFYQVFKEINVLDSHLETMVSLCYVRHSIDTSDKFYDEETEYWDKTLPNYQVFQNEIYDIILSVPFKEELKEFIPDTYFKMAEFAQKSFSKEIIPLLQEENSLVSKYGKLKASAKIPFENEILNLAQIHAKTLVKDRNQRKAAYDAKINFYAKHEAEFDDIFDKLVKVRTKIAKELGYKNFIELGYLRMNRFDYDQKMVANYRKQIKEDVVPLVNSLFVRQARRLNLESLKYYDESFEFLTGNPKPKGTPKELVAKAVNMYHDMSPETKEFIDVMNEADLWDLESKPSKEMGGYCTTFPDYKVPFIFSNFNGTSGDVDVLTHEAGHAFQAYQSKDIEVLACQSPTYESCEIHSMSMEFFAYKYMPDFFKEDTDKYYFLHLEGTLKFLPYGVLVDHFQHVVYEHPEMSIAERKAAYRKLEKEYLPRRDYEDNELLNKGCYWYQQGHIFQSPFYYIDYTLAQVCALQFWGRMQDNDPNYWKDYLHLCKLGGTKSFVNLVKEANLKSPFEDGCLKDVVKKCSDYFATIDDTKL